MRRVLVPLLASLLLAGCYRVLDDGEELLRGEPGSGRARVARELEPPVFLRKSSPLLGILTTGLSSLVYLVGLDAEELPPDARVRFVLPDETVVEGLLFPAPRDGGGARPLLIASFGFLQDRFGSEAAKFHDRYLRRLEHRIAAHVLVLDHPTSGAFLGNNGTLSPGSYDDARIWIEVTRALRRELDVASVHLLGISMSGQTVVHALIEDARRGLGLFASGIAVSIAPDFAVAPGRQLARIEVEEGRENPWREIAPVDEAAGDGLQIQAIRTLVDHQFVPGYRRARPDDADFELPTPRVPLLLWDRFEARLAFLRRSGPADWDPGVSRAGLSAFVASTRIAAVIDRVRTPLVLLSAQDDPAVPSDAFAEVAEAAAGNPWVLAYETPEGGHFGFDVPYGAGYLGDVIELMLDPRVLGSWRGAGHRRGATWQGAAGARAWAPPRDPP